MKYQKMHDGRYEIDSGTGYQPATLEQTIQLSTLDMLDSIDSRLVSIDSTLVTLLQLAESRSR